MISFFFFSSRRRHTRLQGDWSSDVCSSDLFTMQGEWRFANQLDFALRGAADAKLAAGKAGILLQLDILVVRVTPRGLKEEQTKGVAGPAIVTEVALETGLFDACLFVDGSDGAGRVLGDFAKPRMISLRATQDGIDQRRTGGPKIECRQRAAIRRFHQSLIFRGGEEQFACAVAIIVERFHARGEAAGRLLIGDELGADEVAPELRAQVRSVETAENAVPVSVIALRAEEQVACLLQLFAGFGDA